MSACDTDAPECDVSTVLAARKVDLVDGVVGPIARLRGRCARGRDGEDTTARAHDRSVLQSRARVKDEGPGLLGRGDATDLDPALWGVRVTRRREHDRHGS